MKKILVFTFVAVFFLTFQVRAQETVKIGAVDILRVIEQSPQTKSARKLLEKEFDVRNKQIISKQNSLKKMESDFNKDSAIMSDAERAKREKGILSKRRELKRSQEELREDFSFRRNEEFTKIQQKIIEAIETVARNYGYDLILGEGVIYSNSKVDMSDMVIDFLKNGKAN